MKYLLIALFTLSSVMLLSTKLETYDGFELDGRILNCGIEIISFLDHAHNRTLFRIRKTDIRSISEDSRDIKNEVFRADFKIPQNYNSFHNIVDLDENTKLSTYYSKEHLKIKKNTYGNLTIATNQDTLINCRIIGVDSEYLFLQNYRDSKYKFKIPKVFIVSIHEKFNNVTHEIITNDVSYKIKKQRTYFILSTYERIPGILSDNNVIMEKDEREINTKKESNDEALSNEDEIFDDEDVIVLNPRRSYENRVDRFANVTADDTSGKKKKEPKDDVKFVLSWGSVDTKLENGIRLNENDISGSINGFSLLVNSFSFDYQTIKSDSYHSQEYEEEQKVNDVILSYSPFYKKNDYYRISFGTGISMVHGKSDDIGVPFSSKGTIFVPGLHFSLSLGLRGLWYDGNLTSLGIIRAGFYISL